MNTSVKIFIRQVLLYNRCFFIREILTCHVFYRTDSFVNLCDFFFRLQTRILYVIVWFKNATRFNFECLQECLNIWMVIYGPEKGKKVVFLFEILSISFIFLSWFSNNGKKGTNAFFMPGWYLYKINLKKKIFFFAVFSFIF